MNVWCNAIIDAFIQSDVQKKSDLQKWFVLSMQCRLRRRFMNKHELFDLTCSFSVWSGPV